MKESKFLTKEEEIELARIIQDYKNNKDTIYSKEDVNEAYEKLFKSNMRGAYKIVSNYFSYYAAYYYPYEEAIQDALTALASYIWLKHNPDRGTKVLTGATWHIIKALQVNSGKYRDIPLTPTEDYRYNLISKKIKDYEFDNQEYNSLIDYLENTTDVPSKSIHAILNMRKGVKSIDSTVKANSFSNDNVTLAEIIPAENVNPEEVIVQSDLLEKCFSVLTEKEKLLLKMKWDLLPGYKNEDEFLKKHNITKSYYLKNTKNSLNKIKKIMQKEKKKFE